MSNVVKKNKLTKNKPQQIRLFGVKQNNLKNLDVNFNIGELTVVTGPSGSGKSSLVFDTLYAEGQRRYVETFSAYARQFLDRMDKPLVDKIEGVPPAIAIDQTNPVRTSRSSVGTMTELNDHLKLLFARAARLYDQRCAKPVSQATVASIVSQLQQQLAKQNNVRLIITFPVNISSLEQQPHTEAMLQAAGFSKIHTVRQVEKSKQLVLDVVLDRLRWPVSEPQRLTDGLEQALQHGKGVLNLYWQAEQQDWQCLAFSQQLHCPESGMTYAMPTPSLFSFNSPQGACASCKGFGRVIGVDYSLVIPNPKLTLGEGAIKPIQTPAWIEHQNDLIRYAYNAKIPLDKPWQQLTAKQQDWVINGDPAWKGKWRSQWYGIARYFEYLETKAYKMHIRVMLSKYRSYTLCPDCAGARLQTQSLLWRIGSTANANAVLPAEQRFMPAGTQWSIEQLQQLPGLCLHDLMLLPINKLQQFFIQLQLDLPDNEQQAIELLLTEIRQRLNYLCDVGIGYLTLDRQSRTLSGGEVQRINLTTALGTSLVNTLFVLDEPSIGLHPHDMQAVVRAMQALRRAGNTLVVVEHDPAIMLQADRILDMGPGPGAAGGEIVFDGSPRQLLQADTLTGQYLSGKLKIKQNTKAAVTKSTPRLTITKVTQHNLKNITVQIPLQRLVCLTGVSGSGKSTLVQQVLVPALLRHFGLATETPGSYGELLGAQQLSQVVFVDQSAVGKTTRSNPVSYVGAWTSIRNLLAQTPESKQRGYTSAKFSFNSGDGRCPSCTGSGYEHIEMQFLSDVYLQCAECLGKRYRPQVLEVQLQRQQQSLNVSQILDLTVSQARDFFANDLAVLLALQPLEDVGLGYVKLGQPVPTLSGGEAQRLKLAGHLTQATSKQTISKQKIAQKGSLFVFDEPTTGLHFGDIAKLMQALQQLLAVGHSVLVIEHNLDVLMAADWLIDLGPEGGENGGYLQEQGSPQQLIKTAKSYTAQALRDYQTATKRLLTVAEPTANYEISVPIAKQIEIINAKEHNLKSLSVNIPRGKFNVISGVSGSGKSTLAFDIIFNEGQRRYLESLNAYARSIVQPASRPEVDAVYGIAPTVAIEQRLSRGGSKSTVGTVTEIWHFLRLLYVKLGVQHCIHDGTVVQPQTPAEILAQLITNYQGQQVALLSPLVVGRKGIYQELFVTAKQQGFAYLRVDGELISTEQKQRLDRYKEHNIELVVAQTKVGKRQEKQLAQLVELALEHGNGVMQILTLDKSEQLAIYSVHRSCPICNTSYTELDPRLFSYNSKHGWCNDCVGSGLQLDKSQRQALDDSHIDNTQGREQSFIEPDLTDYTQQPCTSCHGSRLNLTARAVLFEQSSIVELAHKSVQELAQWIDQLKLSSRANIIAKPIRQEIANRLQFLQQVGLEYLTLDRGAPTLSGGEAQRIRLAAQLGSNLQGVCYILDEPTIGLHPRDNQRLLDTLHSLCANNNTLLVVEHDEQTIRQAEHLIDIGPGAGSQGGELVAQGTVADLIKAKNSQTGQYLCQPMHHPLQPRRVLGKVSKAKTADASQAVQWLEVQQASLHNLKKIKIKLPLQSLVAITGVSGSGKSTLAREIIFPNIRQAAANKLAKNKIVINWQGCAKITGYESIDRVLEVDQTPIGKTSRSCPATYVGFWDAIRQLFAQTIEAKMHGYTASRFSFNVAQGRCDTCQGNGVRTIAMSFLPDVKVSCESCRGARFNQQTLAVTWQGKDIGQVLQLSVEQAVEFFASMPNICHPLQLLKDVGLGYLTLGQPSPTLSGGEAQRIKLVTELSKVRDDVTKRGQKAPHTLYLLDEPTVGLHMADVEKLLRVLHRLVDAGHSLVVVEHDLDLIAEADWIIDLGPEGGKKGGELVAQATPEQLVAKYPNSYTAIALKSVLNPS